MTYFRRQCFASVCSYNRDTRCSEARLLFKDGRATHLASLMYRGSATSPVSAADRWVTVTSATPPQCLLARMLCVYTWSTVNAPPSPTCLQSPRARWIEFPVNVSSHHNVIGVGLLAYHCNRLCAVRACNVLQSMTCDNCKTNNTAVKMTTVQRISEFRKDT